MFFNREKFKKRLRIYLIVLVVVAILGGSFSLLNFYSFFSTQKKLICEDNIQAQIIKDMLIVKDNTYLCEKRNNLLLCEIASFKEAPYLRSYFVVDERTNNIYLTISVDIKAIEDILQGKTLRDLCHDAQYAYSKEIDMCVARIVKCREI